MSEDTKLPPFIRSIHFKKAEAHDTIAIPAGAVSLDPRFSGALILRIDRETFMNLARNNAFNIEDSLAQKSYKLLRDKAAIERQNVDVWRGRYSIARSKLFEPGD